MAGTAGLAAAVERFQGVPLDRAGLEMCRPLRLVKAMTAGLGICKHLTVRAVAEEEQDSLGQPQPQILAAMVALERPVQSQQGQA